MRLKMEHFKVLELSFETQEEEFHQNQLFVTKQY